MPPPAPALACDRRKPRAAGIPAYANRVFRFLTARSRFLHFKRGALS
jgi:hypothetical protein